MMQEILYCYYMTCVLSFINALVRMEKDMVR